MSEAVFTDEFITVRDGLRLHYRDYVGSPDLPPILCLHGLTRNHRDFVAIAERHAPRFRVVLLDFRGRGDSDPDPESQRYTPLTYGGDVIELLDHLGMPQAIFIGTSLGGLVTMVVGATAPQRIAATILNDVGPEIGAVGIERILAYVGTDARFATWEQAADAIARNQGPSFPSYEAADWLAMAKRTCREDNGEIRFDYDMAIAEPFRAASAVPTVDLWPLFDILAHKPLLVVRGELSTLLSPETFERMVAAPGVSSVIVPGVGHAPELDEPAAEAAIDAFLDDCARRAVTEPPTLAG